MKNFNLYIVGLLLFLFSCSKNDEIITDQNGTNQEITDDLQLSIEFLDGPHTGKHIFKEIKDDIQSNIDGDLNTDYTSFEFKNIENETNLILNNFRRSIEGELIIGKLNSKQFTNGCGSLFFRDTDNKFSYKEIRADFNGCTPTEILELSSWEKEVVYNKRKVKAQFEETIKMKIINDDNSSFEINTTIKVSFIAEQKKLIL
ncbi:hypothetical protein [Tenacibaculum sp. 190524A05c]|uniref:hypothetical protein n=1 Tax=Tenacibaculum platacis TaxID=3137852 RepID=UPI0032B118E3